MPLLTSCCVEYRLAISVAVLALLAGEGEALVVVNSVSYYYCYWLLQDPEFQFIYHDRQFEVGECKSNAL